MTSTKVLIFACATVLAASSSAFAQRWGHGRTPRDGACFYKDADFSGEYFCVSAGSNLPTIEDGLNDKISSMRLFGNTEVTVYRDRHFNGRSTRFGNDVHNLKNAGWNDTISSIEVRSRGGYRHDTADVDRIVRRAYQDILGREPDPAGFRGYRSRMIDDGWT